MNSILDTLSNILTYYYCFESVAYRYCFTIDLSWVDLIKPVNRCGKNVFDFQ